MDLNSLNRAKWVRIMCDYEANGVWDRAGRCCDLDDLPVSPELRRAIRAWQEWYELGCPGERFSRGFVSTAHAHMGLAIAIEVKVELPDWTVIYFDEEKLSLTHASKSRDRTFYEYEITGDLVSR